MHASVAFSIIIKVEGPLSINIHQFKLHEILNMQINNPYKLIIPCGHIQEVHHL